MKRLGIFGGSFDPVHSGHVGIARAAADAAALEKVLFVPANVSPFKTSAAPRASAADRLEMVRLACACDRRFEPCDIELRRAGVSYAVDTVRAIAAANPGAELFFIMGEDSLAALGGWHKADELFSLVVFLVLERPGCARNPVPEGARVVRFRGEPCAVSSSAAREAIAGGGDAGRMLPPSVAAYIARHGLYRP